MPCVMCGEQYDGYERLLMHECPFQFNTEVNNVKHKCRICDMEFDKETERNCHERRGHVRRMCYADQVSMKA